MKGTKEEGKERERESEREREGGMDAWMDAWMNKWMQKHLATADMTKGKKNFLAPYLKSLYKCETC